MYLIIYVLVSNHCLSQSLHLTHISNNERHLAIIDSLSTNKKYTNFKNLNESNDSLFAKLHKLGFMNMLSGSLKKINDTTYTQKISLGDKYRVIELIAGSNDRVIDSLIEITLSRKRDKNYTTPLELETKITALHGYLVNKGFAFTKIKTDLVSLKKQDTIELKLTVETRDIRYINNIQIKGYENFPSRYIEPIIKRKYIVSDQNIDKIKDRFKKMPFVEITKEPELLFKQDSTILYMYINKKSNNILDGLIGFNNNDGGNLEINGYLDLQLNNNLNNGEQLHLIYRGDDKDQTQLDLTIELPYLFKSKIGLSAGLNILRRDSTYQNSRLRSGLFYSFNPQTRTGFSYSSTRSSTSAITETNNAFNTQGVIMNLHHEIYATDALFIYNERAHIEIGTSVRNIEGQKTNQLSINAQLEKNIALGPKHSFHVEGKLLLLDSDNILFNELYQVGGINSIRGFNQNSIDTSFFTALNTEYRYKISRGIYLHSILDYAIFEDFTSSQTENIYGIGVGTAILTQSGILRISVANGAFSGANLDLSSTVAHINLKIKF